MLGHGGLVIEGSTEVVVLVQDAILDASVRLLKDD